MLSAIASSLRRPPGGELDVALRREAVLAPLGDNRHGLAVEIVDEVDSTSSELLRRAATSDIDRRVLVAERQTAGRGRRGRAWIGVPGGSLAFSLGWRFARSASELSALPLAVGLAVCRALEAEGFAGIELKWPNDLVRGGAKLAGVLVELSREGLGPSVAVIGIGINVRLPAGVRRRIGQPATDLASVAARERIDRNALLARVVRELAEALQAYASDGFAPFRVAWQQRHALHGKTVDLALADGGRVRGKVRGVDADGALLVSRAGRTLRFVSGEVSLAKP